MTRKVIAHEWMSLDGVVQAPGTPDEDRSGGFAYGGWHLRYFDPRSQEWVVDGLARAGAFLLGRITYENFAGYWPNASEEERAISEPLNSKRKYVASTTVAEPLPWQNSTLLGGDVVKAVAALKEEDGGNLHLIGSTKLAQTLIAHDLIDEFQLMIDPLVLGGGKRLFGDDGILRRLRLVHSEPTTTGAILATYTLATS
jgi:dihydrofolate reductase